MEYTHVHLLSSYFYQHCVNSTSKTNLGWPGQLPPSTLALFEMPGVPCVWERNRHEKCIRPASLHAGTVQDAWRSLCVRKKPTQKSIRYCYAASLHAGTVRDAWRALCVRKKPTRKQHKVLLRLPPSTLALPEMPGVPCVWDRNRHEKALGAATPTLVNLPSDLAAGNACPSTT